MAKGTVKRLPLPSPSEARLAESLGDVPLDSKELIQNAKDNKKTVLYLAYGSNLANETFRGRRNIKPIAQVNVQVPSLKLTFDLPGIPYIEPCFANSAKRDSKDSFVQPTESKGFENEKTELLRKGGYHKDRWHKGLIGVVYEVTAADYAQIIKTEGGGSSYQDILVDCHPLATEDPSELVPLHPTKPAFRAHTLFAPALPPDEPPPKDGGRLKRPDASYAQASARYLKLMRDGAAELGLPYEYQHHLESLRAYQITTIRQRIGQVAFLALWVPLVAMVFGLGRLFANKEGKIPGWLRQLSASVFQAMWTSYDNVFKPLYGDGERTLTDGKGDSQKGAIAPSDERIGENTLGKESSVTMEKVSLQLA